MTLRIFVRIGIFIVLACVSLRTAIAATSDPEFETRVRAELEAVAPTAVPSWEQANAARSEGRGAEALELYGKVLELAPRFDHAHRRMCNELVRVGRRNEAIAACETAVSIAASHENHAMLALALIQPPHRRPDLERADELIQRAVAVAPRDQFTLVVLCQVQLARDDSSSFESCVKKLQAVDRMGLEANMFGTMTSLMHGNVESARAALARARAAGLEDEPYDELAAAIDRMDGSGGDSSHAGWGFWRIGLALVLCWLGALVVLFVAGWILSALALRAARQGPGELRAEATAGERRLRRVYGVVIWLCGLFFYLSVPIMLFTVIGLGGGLILLIVATGHIPIKLVLVLGFLVLATVWAVLRSVFVRGDDSDPGIALDPEEHPRLQAVLREVAGQIGTRPVDAVFVTPTTDLAVFERGGMLKQLRGSTQRCLILGVGVLDGLQLDGFRSVLAHEYGHFRNADTASGGFALAARRSMYTMVFRLAQSGAAAWYNPAWLFLRGFHTVFLRISQGASRLQEVLADRWAAIAYGSAAFERGFSHVIARSVRFDAHIDATLSEVIDQKRPLANLYRYAPEAVAKPERAQAVDEAIAAVMNREPGPYDSHPAPQQRLAWVRALGAPAHPRPDDAEPVWSLFEDREALELRMTKEVRVNIAMNHGVQIAARPEDVETDV